MKNLIILVFFGLFLYSCRPSKNEIATVSFLPAGGWVVGGAYLGADLLTKYVSGKLIGDHLDNYVEENYDKDGGTLVNWK